MLSVKAERVFLNNVQFFSIVLSYTEYLRMTLFVNKSQFIVRDSWYLHCEGYFKGTEL